MRLLLLLLMVPLFSCVSEEKPAKLKVLTFNILGGRNVDGKRDLKKVADVIKALNPDIVAMQEVDKGTGRIQKRHITKELAEMLDMHFAFAKAMDYDGGEYGEAVLSKYPILEKIRHPLPAEKGAEPRVMLTVKVNIPGTETPYLFNATHLDHLRKPDNRLMQTKAIIKILDEQKLPWILAGDLNARPDSATIKMLSGEAELYKKSMTAKTYPVKNPRVQIDWLMTDKSEKWKLLKAYTGDKLSNPPAGWQKLLEVASDHLPLYAEFELKNKK